MRGRSRSAYNSLCSPDHGHVLVRALGLQFPTGLSLYITVILSCNGIGNMICSSQSIEGGFYGQGYQGRAPSLRGRDFETDEADGRFWRVQKWLAILIATVDPCPARQIAQHTGLAEQTIHNLISSYNRLGPQALKAQVKAIGGELI